MFEILTPSPAISLLMMHSLALGYTSITWNHNSRVLNIFFTPASSTPPPSGSTTSMHLAIAIVCFTSLALIHTRPFKPTATSRGNRAPRRGSRKCFGSSRLCNVKGFVDVEVTSVTHRRHIIRLHRTTNPPSANTSTPTTSTATAAAAAATSIHHE